MKEKIEQLSKGFMTYELPHIVLSEEKIALSVQLGRSLSATVTISNEADMHMKGLVYSSNPLVTVTTAQFVGSENNIEFVAHAEYAEVGDKLAGDLTFVTNCGEITLPYCFEVVPPSLMSLEGEIENMVQFATLAKENQAEAKRLFTTKEFEAFLKYYEPKNAFLWERILKSPTVDVALEQFLVATRKKMAVSFEVSSQSLEYNVGGPSFSDVIKITKNNWGYLSLNVTCDAPFLNIEQEIVRNDDFIGSEYEVKFVVDPEKMYYGINTCTINIMGCGLTTTIPVVCTRPHLDKPAVENKKYVDRLVIKAVDNYIAFAMNQIPTGRYVSEAQAVLDRYENKEGADVIFAKLYRANLLRVSGKESPANAIIASLSEEAIENANSRTYGFYLYMMASRAGADKSVYMEKLYSLCSANPDDFLTTILVTKLDDRYERNPRLKMDELRALHKKGCHSPIMYMEAAKVLNTEPLLLKDLGEFEVQTVLYSLKKGFCNRDLAAQFTALVLRNKGYSKIYYNTLSMIYEKYQLKDTLTAICQLLVKGYRKENRYFKWYQKGVEENVRISDLYEYYMYSLDRDVEDDLEQTVLMYYVYNSKLNDRKLAYLYANIVLHKDSNPIVYENYKEKLRLFTLQQMRDGKNSKVLAILYNDYLSDEKASNNLVEYLYKVVFRYDVTCTNSSMRYICVAHKELESEIVVPLIGGQAQIDLFTDDALVFMQDAAGERYYAGDSITITKLLSDDSLINRAYLCNRDKEQLILSLAEKAHKMRKYDQMGIDLRKQVSQMNGVTDEYREMYLSELALYFFDHAQDEIAEDDLKKLNYKLLSPARRGKFIGLLILREQYMLADKLIAECGFMDVEVKLLEKYAVSLPANVLNQYNKSLCDLMYYLFLNGRRNERILIYLVNFYDGPTASLYSIWQEGVIAQCATSELDEKLLVQILFTESYLPFGEQVYTHYYRRAKSRMITKAYFNYLAYKYLISDVPITKTSIENMKKDSYFETNEIVLLALLKQYANAAELTKEEQEFAKTWLEVLDNKGKILPAFTAFAKYFRLPENMEDKVYIEYRSNPDHRVTIHIATRQDGKRIVTEEPMRNVCYGIFVKEIVLFAKETIEYVISDEGGNETINNEKHTITGNPDNNVKSKSRFARINAIINARNAKDKSKSMELLNEYVKNEFAISQLFHEI